MIAPLLPATLVVSAALDAGRTITSGDALAEALGPLAPHLLTLSDHLLVTFWSDMLYVLSTGTRAHLLSALAVLAPTASRVVPADLSRPVCSRLLDGGRDRGLPSVRLSGTS